MNWSKFNTIFKLENEYYLYNSLSNSFACISKNLYLNIKNQQKIFYSNSQTYKQLTSARAINRNHSVVIEEMKNSHFQSIYSKELLQLTILPTTECNFSCKYCYLKNVKKSTINQETISKLIKFIQNLNFYKKINIIWYGGEALLAFDKIIEITEKIKNLSKIKDKNIEIDSELVTNGSLLNGEIIGKLNDVHINRIQITLDGPTKIHNRRRPFSDLSGSYSKILSNLDFLFKSNSEIKVAVRINIDKENQNVFFSFL